MRATTEPMAVSQLVDQCADEVRPPVDQLVSEMYAARAPGAPLDAAAVLARHPELAANRAVVRDLAYEEYLDRVEAGETLDREAFVARFPTCPSSLRELICANQFLDQHPDLLAGRSWPAVGQTLLGFQLLRQLGQGKVARVFLARESALGNRLVALKVSCLRTAEAETLGRLRHPNIVLVHSVQEDAASGLSVVCMAYHGRATLADVLEYTFKGPTPPRRADLIREAVRNAALAEETLDGTGVPRPVPLPRGASYVDSVLDLALPLVDALAYVHAQKILHLDLKPSNVLVSPNGQPLLLDFNLSFDARATVRWVGGTLAYMSPEQLLATQHKDGSRLEARSDLYSLGVMLYELLTGRHPFGPVPWADSADEQRAFFVARQRQPPLPLRQANPQVDRPLARLIEQCLAHDAKDRPATAEDLARSLRAAQGRGRVRRWLAAHVRGLTVTVLLLAATAGVAVAMALRPPAFQRGREAYQQGRFAEALDHFNQAYDANGASADVLFARGRAHQHLTHFSLAVTDYAAALALARDEELKARLRACLAYCHGQLNNHLSAMGYYDQLRQAGWKSAGMLNNGGWSGMQIPGASREQAGARFQEAIALDAGLLPAYYNRAKYHLAKALEDVHYPSQWGIADIEQAVRLQPDSPWLHHEAAWHYLVALRHTGDKKYRESAMAAAEKALDLGLGTTVRMDRMLMDMLKGHPRFPKLLEARPAVSVPPLAPSRLVDPLRGLEN